MPVAWYIGPYIRNDTIGHGAPTRVTFIRNGNPPEALSYRCVEVLGSYAVCKVRASDAVLDQIGALPNVDRLNKDLLNESLADLSPAVKQRLKDIAQSLGYTLQEINDRFPGDLGSYTLGDVLRFFGKRWRRPFWNGTTIVFSPLDSDPPATVDTVRVDEAL